MTTAGDLQPLAAPGAMETFWPRAGVASLLTPLSGRRTFPWIFAKKCGPFLDPCPLSKPFHDDTRRWVIDVLIAPEGAARNKESVASMKVVRGNLHRLAYCSKVRLTGKSRIEDDLPGILKIAQARNSAVDVTGALLVCNGWFVQELEGPMQPVLETYGRITRDARHEQLTIIEAIPTGERHFASWSMCGLHVSPIDRDIVQVLSSGGAFDPTKLSATRALNLLVSVGKMQRKTVAAPL